MLSSKMFKIIVRVVLIACTFVIIAVGICNIIKNDNFWDLSFANLFSLIFVIVISFLFSQRLTDERKQIEKAEIIVREIQQLVTSIDFTRLFLDEQLDNETFRKKIAILRRTINNKISIASEYGEILDFKKEIEYIQDQFDKYREMVDNHLDDKDYLEKSQIDFECISQAIDSKCDFIILHLYVPKKK